jgi:hypothetical protein
MTIPQLDPNNFTHIVLAIVGLMMSCITVIIGPIVTYLLFRAMRKSGVQNETLLKRASVLDHKVDTMAQQNVAVEAKVDTANAVIAKITGEPSVTINLPPQQPTA